MYRLYTAYINGGIGMTGIKENRIQRAYKAYVNKRWPNGNCSGTYDTVAIAEIYRDAFQAGVQSQKPAIITAFHVTVNADQDCILTHIMEKVRELIYNHCGVRQVEIIQVLPKEKVD